jgi:hypothetical protein
MTISSSLPINFLFIPNYECNAWPVPPSWEVRLLQDSKFATEIRDKYFIFRKNILSQTHINHIIDSVAILLDVPQSRHYQKWEILGINVGTPESGEQPLTYSGEIQKFKRWISTRLAWLDANMVGKSYGFREDYHAVCRIFPIPAGDYLYFESDTIISKVILYNLSGIPVREKTDCNDYSVSMNLNNLSPGLYIMRIYFGHGEIITRRLVK